MDNAEIARLLAEITDLLEIRGENVFKVRAYQKAARAVENLAESLAELHKRGELKSIDGIGKGMAEKIQEALDTGKIAYHEELLASLPAGLLELLNVSGMGPKKTKLVYETLGIASIDQLQKAAEAGQLQSLPGMGKKTEEKILKGIANLRQSAGRFHLGAAYAVAEDIVNRLRQIDGVQRVEFAGSLRRGKETVGDVDILAAAENSEAAMQEFLATKNRRDILAQGETKLSIVLHSGLQVDLRSVPLLSFGAALQYFTGSKEHNVKLRELAVRQGIKINEYGVFDAKTEERLGGENEEDIYQALGLPIIVPELREGFDEIELAREGKLPPLIEAQDIQSAIHNHTVWSDGRMTLDELVEEAKRRGYRFIAVTDHSGSLGVANGLNPDRLQRQIEEIHRWNETHKGFRILTGSEVDIRADGSLDFPDDLLEQLDVVIAAIHSSFEQPRDKMTQRICSAIENPNIDILAHPTGRMIGQRPPLDIDLERLFSTAAASRTALEINAHYYRLDLNDKHIREAKTHGVKFTLDTDTHSKADFDNLKFGLQTARRGRLEAGDVLNTLPLKAFLKAIAK
ncbi:MAG: DNA polymerase/3'-5' exonuclease PolX [Candidatus Omnitrophota bacterium]